MKLKKVRKALIAAGFFVAVVIVALIVVFLLLLLFRKARSGEAAAERLSAGEEMLTIDDGETFEERMASIALLHKAAVGGDLDAAKQASRELLRLRRARPADPLAAAYQGSLLVQLSRETDDGRERLRQVKRGLKLLDGAVAAAPSDLTIRRLRGRVSFRLPEKVFSRTETAVEDYVALLDGERERPGSVDDELYAGVLDELREAYERLNRPQDAARVRALTEEHTKRREAGGFAGDA